MSTPDGTKFMYRQGDSVTLCQKWGKMVSFAIMDTSHMTDNKRRTQADIRLLFAAVEDNWHVMDSDQKAKEVYTMLDILFNYVNERNTEIAVKLDKRRSTHLSLSHRVAKMKHTLDCLTDK